MSEDVFGCDKWGGRYYWDLVGRGQDAIKILQGTRQSPGPRTIRSQMPIVLKLRNLVQSERSRLQRLPTLCNSSYMTFQKRQTIGENIHQWLQGAGAEGTGLTSKGHKQIWDWMEILILIMMMVKGMNICENTQGYTLKGVSLTYVDYTSNKQKQFYLNFFPYLL